MTHYLKGNSLTSHANLFTIQKNYTDRKTENVEAYQQECDVHYEVVVGGRIWHYK